MLHVLWNVYNSALGGEATVVDVIEAKMIGDGLLQDLMICFELRWLCVG